MNAPVRPLRVVFFGHVRYSSTALQRVLELPDVDVAGIVTRRSCPSHADFCCLTPIADAAHVPSLAVDDLPQDRWADWIRDRRPDVGYAIGWSTILEPVVLAVPKLGIIGYHQTLLPRNRGHHPIVWALALGLSETGSTFFFLDEGIDSGDIVSQRRVPILPDDDAGTLYEKLTRVAIEQIAAFSADLANGHLRRIPQDQARATVWRRRCHDDGEVDWRMTASAIHDLVRALTHPYVGAHAMFRGRAVKIWKTAPRDVETPRDLEPGRVLAVNERRFTVRCGDGALEILDHELEPIPEVGRCLR